MKAVRTGTRPCRCLVIDEAHLLDGNRRPDLDRLRGYDRSAVFAPSAADLRDELDHFKGTLAPGQGGG